MTTKAILIAGLLTLTTLALAPPATGETSIAIQYCAGLPSVCNFAKACAPPATGEGGVVGATITYASNVAAIGCTAAKQEAAHVVATSLSACGTTADYVIGGDCSTTCTCDPQPILPPIRSISVDTTRAMAANSMAVAPVMCHFAIKNQGGVVGDTTNYVSAMGNLGCNSALVASYIAAGAAIGICNETGDYALGNPYWCQLYVTA